MAETDTITAILHSLPYYCSCAKKDMGESCSQTVVGRGAGCMEKENDSDFVGANILPSIGCDSTTSDEEDDDSDLFVNTNRPPPLECDSTSSEEEED